MLKNILAVVLQQPNDKLGSMGQGVVVKKNVHSKNQEPTLVRVECSSFPHHKHLIIVGEFRLRWYFSHLITKRCSQLDTCCNGSSIVLVLLTTYTSVSRDKIVTVLPENPNENFPAYHDSLDCVIKKKKKW